MPIEAIHALAGRASPMISWLGLLARPGERYEPGLRVPLAGYFHARA